MNKGIKTAAKLHENVPPDWYFRSIKENLLQRYWHWRRFSEVGKLVDKVEGKVLDIGCADGVFSRIILDKSQAKELMGIDVLKTSVDWANKHWKESLPAGRQANMRFEIGDAHKLRFPSRSFDAVFVLEVLEHVADPKRVLLEIKRVLKKGGYGIFLVPSDSRLFRVIWFFWTKTRGKIWDDTHIQTYRNNQLTRLAKDLGFRIEVDKKFILGMLHLIKVRKN